ncbi:hypothetical protein EV644_101506 [Kribbella orskensis]|uniref:Uncharacterized protein n=1 Tax=Kribbella orskensis TaxID=2512216 RepID=A0ABY2BY85_9ACTN|nr:hypothetical protein EV642_101483 [Kribbella sp. VKM Ac-2500]TCO31863.1 hypothetical protein EV644_101506 [Kribbella orskensis]
MAARPRQDELVFWSGLHWVDAGRREAQRFEVA